MTRSYSYARQLAALTPIINANPRVDAVGRASHARRVEEAYRREGIDPQSITAAVGQPEPAGRTAKQAVVSQPKKQTSWISPGYRTYGEEQVARLKAEEPRTLPEPSKAAPIGSRAEQALALKGLGPLASTGSHYARQGSRADRALALAGKPRPKDAPQ